MTNALVVPAEADSQDTTEPGNSPASLLLNAPTINLRGHEQAAQSVLMDDVSLPFSAERLALVRLPLDAGGFRLDRVEPRWQRRNHYLIKRRLDDTPVLEGLEKTLVRFCQRALADANKRGLPVQDRYAYLTVDDRWVEKGQTQRQDGWHIDGMQGSEVATPTPGCYQYVWSDCAPMAMALQGFNVEGFDRHTVNFFESLARQVHTASCKRFAERRMMLMSAYLVHKAMPVPTSGYRRFLRLYLTHQPITSVKATLNPLIDYDYEPQTTSGEIPSGLSIV